MKWAALLILFLLIAVIFGVQTANKAKQVNTKNIFDEKSFTKIRSNIGEQIGKVGGITTFNSLKKDNSEDYIKAHNVFHIFGEELYKKEGINAIKVCDDSYGFGCFHGFSTEAIGQKGEGVIQNLEKACSRDSAAESLGCAHGLGHGILEYVGHDNLNKALALCKTLSWKGKLFGCQDGVFMEYNFPNALSATSTKKIRDFDENKADDICLSVSEEFRRSCFYSLGQWWLRSITSESAGKLCEAEDDEYYKETCYLGIGNAIVPDTNFNLEESAMRCQEMPTQKGKIVCSNGAYKYLINNPKYKSRADFMCNNFSTQSKELCLSDSIVTKLEF